MHLRLDALRGCALARAQSGRIIGAPYIDIWHTHSQLAKVAHYLQPLALRAQHPARTRARNGEINFERASTRTQTYTHRAKTKTAIDALHENDK